MDSEKEKNRLSDIVLERVGLTGNLLSAPVSPSLEPVVEIPSHGSQVRAGKVTGPEEYKRRFLVPAPRAAEWKTAYIDGRLHRRIAMLVRAAGCGSISGFIIRLLELHMEEHREDIAALPMPELTELRHGQGVDILPDGHGLSGRISTPCPCRS